jgi:hypothetical protein
MGTASLTAGQEEVWLKQPLACRPCLSGTGDEAGLGHDKPAPYRTSPHSAGIRRGNEILLVGWGNGLHTLLTGRQRDGPHNRSPRAASISREFSTPLPFFLFPSSPLDSQKLGGRHTFWISSCMRWRWVGVSQIAGNGTGRDGWRARRAARHPKGDARTSRAHGTIE